MKTDIRTALNEQQKRTHLILVIVVIVLCAAFAAFSFYNAFAFEITKWGSALNFEGTHFYGADTYNKGYFPALSCAVVGLEVLALFIPNRRIQKLGAGVSALKLISPYPLLYAYYYGWCVLHVYDGGGYGVSVSFYPMFYLMLALGTVAFVLHLVDLYVTRSAAVKKQKRGNQSAAQAEALQPATGTTADNAAPSDLQPRG